MTNYSSILKDKSLLLLFAYSPAGFGHLRVSDALYHGLPTGAYPHLLGSQDKTITYIHRLMSIHSITRALFEWFEQGWAEEFTTPLYRFYLRRHTGLLYQQINTIIDQSILIPKQLLIVATHFGLAHQAAAIKQKIMKERKIKVTLVVQVTDDYPHPIWYVPGADIVFVPSQHTKDRLMTYGRKKGLPEVNLEVNPYPLSSALNSRLNHSDQSSRPNQLDPTFGTEINVAIPISGAAVGMKFVSALIDNLHLTSDRFKFHIVSKNAPFTSQFVSKMNERQYVKIYSSSRDKEVIEIYEELYMSKVISLEVTKPSEQAFKALISPRKKGGSILLFSRPIGRQEYDNLNFLRRYKLIPQQSVQNKLWAMAKSNNKLEKKDKKEIYQSAKNWRGLFLPEGSKTASNFIFWCLRERIFSTMLSCMDICDRDNNHEYVLQPDGVLEFWKKTAEKLL